MKFTTRISKPSIGPLEKAGVLRVLESEYFGMGPETTLFQKQLEDYFGNGMRAVCVNTGTSALHLSLNALSLSPGDEVLVPTLTYLATFQAISVTGATPVACDIDPETGLLDLHDAELRLTPKTKALLPVHYAGNPGDWNALHAFASAHRLRVVEDAAHAFGSTFQGQKIGSIGDLVCFSFDGIKNITCGEGGAVLTKDAATAEQISRVRVLGIQKKASTAHTLSFPEDFDVQEQGFRYHMSDLNAAIGQAQLRRFEGELKIKRVALKKHYDKALEGLSEVRRLNMNEGTVPHIYPVRILNGKRDAAREALHGHGIPTGLHYKPNHSLSKYGGGKPSLPNAEKFYSEALTLPLHPDVGPDLVDQAGSILRDILD